VNREATSLVIMRDSTAMPEIEHFLAEVKDTEHRLKAILGELEDLSKDVQQRSLDVRLAGSAPYRPSRPRVKPMLAGR
jgi:hypothetical protein